MKPDNLFLKQGAKSGGMKSKDEDWNFLRSVDFGRALF